MIADQLKDYSDVTFCRLIQQGPAFLFLGQDCLRLATGGDPFLAEAVRKYGPQDASPTSYSELLRGSASVNQEAALAWMDELCRRLGPPQWLTTVAGVAWSGVHSSAIDTVWPRAFRNEWRDTRPLFEEKYRPSDPRNRVQLHCSFLFGNVNRTEEAEAPPLTQFAFAKRKQIAVSLTRRLPELITPLGILAVEAYAFDRDWLSEDDLWSVVDELNSGQTHVFSVPVDGLRHPFAQHLLKAGKIIAHHYSLAAALTRGEEAGVIKLNQQPRDEGLGQSITLSPGAVAVPKDLRNLTNRSAMILDDGALAPPPELSAELKYRDFRRFLASAEGRPKWEAYAQGFAFARTFQAELESRAEQLLASKELADAALVLHGQTGTGKTVALASLAFTVRKRLRYPVLFIERKAQRPSVTDIDRFCKWAEDVDAPSCLIVWDGMLEPGEYSEFLRQLTSRGRKLAVVGSSYRVTETNRADPHLLEAPAQLSSEETGRFREFLGDIDGSLAAAIDLEAIAHDETFLVALYRLLPLARGHIRAGVAREIGLAEQVISQRAAETPTQPAPTTVLGLALLRAGLISKDKFFDVEEGTNGPHSVSDLTNLVMVPGRFGLVVPFEILLRVLGKDGYAEFSHLFRGVDIFRWDEDSVGNITVGPRNALEARLLVQARLGGPQAETATARRLLMEIRDDYGGVIEGREVRFAVDLVRAMGAQGNDGSYFAPYFDDLSETLRQLRETRDVRSPKLMLQEANLSREWAVGLAKAGGTDQRIHDALDRAEQVIRSALEMIGGDRRYRFQRSALTVELGSVLGSKIRFLLDNAPERFRGVEQFSLLRNALEDARKEDPSNYHPIDVLAWSTKAVLERGVLNHRERVEAIADVLYAFQSTDPKELRPDQVERFHSRQLELAGLIGASDLEEKSFNDLLARGSSAGYYLRALQLAGLTPRSGTGDPPGVSQRLRGLEYLQEHAANIAADARCQSLRFDLWWWVNAGNRPFERERTAVPFSQRQWQECLEIVDGLLELGPSHRKVMLDFIRALTLFHLGKLTEAFEIFRDVERESEQVRGRRRVVRSYLASAPDGRPMKVHGQVAWIADDGTKGEVYVEELRRRIQFIPRDFGRSDLMRGESLGEFHIAFNFIGPLADPADYFRP